MDDIPTSDVMTGVRSLGTVSLGTVLGVWAHPDDEAYLSGGLMALAGVAGSRVVCVTATRGERGTTDPRTWPPRRLAAQRSDELGRCLEILGVGEHHWLGHRHGGCAEVSVPFAVGQLCTLIVKVRPQTVVTFGPDGVTGHPDHQAVSAWVSEAFDRAAPPDARLLHAAVTERWVQRWSVLNEQFAIFARGYPITTPTDRLAIDLLLDPDTAARKVRVLRAQVTQTAELVAAMGLDTYTAWTAEESFVERAPS
ncbi:MAG: PIG-L deacetylase family protein [Pseudonocardiaceae bacterium]